MTDTRPETTTARPVVTTKRSQWHVPQACPKCGAEMPSVGEYQTVCDACACIEIEIENRRRQVYA